MEKLPAWTHRFVLPLVVSGLMATMVLAVSTYRVAGFSGLEEHWFSFWLVTWVIAFPTLVIILPLVNKIVSLVVEKPSV